MAVGPALMQHFTGRACRNRVSGLNEASAAPWAFSSNEAVGVAGLFAQPGVTGVAHDRQQPGTAVVAVEPAEKAEGAG